MSSIQGFRQVLMLVIFPTLLEFGAGHHGGGGRYGGRNAFFELGQVSIVKQGRTESSVCAEDLMCI